MEYSLHPYGHRAWVLKFPNDGFSKTLCLNILQLSKLFQAQGDEFWQEIVPAYDSLLLKTGYGISAQESAVHIEAVMISFTPQDNITPTTPIDIPVTYGGEHGPDLDYVAETCGLTPKEIIARHSERSYLVCMMGFIPGFAFLSEIDTALHIARRTDPRAHVPAGSVGLAGWQTGVYGLESPGGWQIIGRTSSVMFDPQRETPFLLKSGDWIRFVPTKASGKA